MVVSIQENNDAVVQAAFGFGESQGVAYQRSHSLPERVVQALHVIGRLTLAGMPLRGYHPEVSLPTVGVNQGLLAHWSRQTLPQAPR
jgi:hypothetical protein